jgi:predicted RNA-binding protein with PIN domain
MCGMEYLIDTYNLVHAAAALGGPLGDMSVRKLCRYVAAAGRKATLVLDGRAKPDEPGAGEFPQLTLVYAGTGVTADSVIGQLVARAGNRKKVTVVTNDRAVALQARGCFANGMSCEQFLKEITEGRPVMADEPGEKQTGTATAGEADLWMKEFGITGDPNVRGGAAGGARVEEGDVEGLDIEGLLGPRG